MAEKQKSFSIFPKIINGGVAGIVGVTSVFPIDLVKTRLQNQQVGPNGEKMYKNILDAFRKVFKQEGFFGMYRGCAVNVLLITPEKALKLAGNDYFRYHFKTRQNTLPPIREMAAGACAGLAPVIVTTPMELLKIQLQDAGRVQASLDPTKKAKKITALGVSTNLIKERGIFGLYRGLGATLSRDIPFAIVYFPSFANLNKFGPRKADGSGDAVFWVSFLSGLTAGAFSAWAVTPMDVVKTRIQAIQKGKGERVYSGILRALIEIPRYEGVPALFKGGACRIMVIAPLFAIAQTVYYLGVGEFILGVQKNV